MLPLLLNCAFLVVYATEYPIVQLQTIRTVGLAEWSSESEHTKWN
jgi:hypothetical protein